MVAALLGGFIVFLAMQGKLGAYWSILIGGGSKAASSGTATAPATTGTTPPATTPPATTPAPPATTPAPHYLIPPMPSLGFPGVTGGLF
jgi:hypothetical protein